MAIHDVTTILTTHKSNIIFTKTKTVLNAPFHTEWCSQGDNTIKVRQTSLNPQSNLKDNYPSRKKTKKLNFTILVKLFYDRFQFYR